MFDLSCINWDDWSKAVLVSEQERDAQMPDILTRLSKSPKDGTVLCEGLRGHAFSMEEFYETFEDEEDRAEYGRPGGRYDVQCPTCQGRNVVDVVDEEACERDPKLKALLKQHQKQEEERAHWAAIDRATERSERLAGC